MRMRALIANEPRVYRDVVSRALRALRPLVEVGVVGPDELDEAVGRLRPHLVFCSRLSAAVERHAWAWVVLYPGGEDRAEIGAGGRTVFVANVQMDDLLSVVDETARAYASEDDR